MITTDNRIPLLFKGLGVTTIRSALSIVILCVAILLSLSSHANQHFPSTTVVINENTRQIKINQSAWIEDVDDALTAKAFAQGKLQGLTINNGESLNFGHSESGFWIGFKILYQPEAYNADIKTWLIELPFPPLQRVSLFQKNEKGEFIGNDIGYDNAMPTRKLAHRNFVFPVTLKPNEEKLLILNIMRTGGSIQAPLTLWSQTEFLMNDGTQNYLMGIFYGTLLSMVLYNAFLYISIRAKPYLYYIIYISLSVLAYMALSGYGFLYLWPETPGFNKFAASILATAGTIAGCFFFKSFTNLPQENTKINQVFNGLIVSGLLLILTIVISNSLLSIYVVGYVGISVITVLTGAIILWRSGSRQAGFFLLAWISFLLGTLCYLALLMGWLPNNLFTRHALQVGCTCEVLLLSFALADQINYERREKYQALEEQHKAIIKLQDMESQLVHRALHSRTTGLPNRALLRRSLDACLSEQTNKGQITLLLISLNNFHEINKTLGHRTGDAILKLVTHRLSEIINSFENAVRLEINDSQSHTLANVEGVTFGFVLRVSSDKAALAQAGIVLQAFQRPFEYKSIILDIESTVGLASYPAHGECTDELLRNAHIALEAANLANNQGAIYSPDIDPYSATRLSRIAELKSAIENDTLQLYFQPQIDLKSHKVIGAEVLIRWIHSEHGFIPPDEFIPIAERTGVIHPLTHWICENAFAALNRFKAANADISLSINISARNLQDRMFQSTVLRLAEENHISTDEIVLELTETAVMINPEEALAMLNALSRTGIRLSIDDFGTGYSSLSYLKQLPVKELKIDRTFVMDMANSQDDQVIVETTLQMAHNLGLSVVAEGIENQETLNRLADQGCDVAQGYHIARPMPENDFIAWLAHYQTNTPARRTNEFKAS